MDGDQIRLAMHVNRMNQIMVEVEAMKAANAMAAFRGLQPQYVHADFDKSRVELWHIENDMRSLF